jgi:hypothetical protein
MKLLSSLQNRVFVASALVALLSIVFAIRFMTVRLGREAEAELQRGLTESATLVEENYAARLEKLSLLARLIADLPKLKAAVETGDPPTIRPLALDYQTQVKSDLFTVTNRDGTVLVSIGAPWTGTGDPDAIRAAIAGHESTTLRVKPEGALQVVTVPVAIGGARHPEPRLRPRRRFGGAVEGRVGERGRLDQGWADAGVNPAPPP